jgi:hypothetical protein
MLRGAIEVATENVVSGWIYCRVVSLRDQLVLAYADDVCVGNGRVEYFRKDLLAAGLGDGYCGFHFAVRLEEDQDPASLTIKLADSDFTLRQAAGRQAAFG